MKDRLKYLFTLWPYGAVFLGLYILKNAFISLWLYNLGLALAVFLFRKKISFKTLFYRKSLKLEIAALMLCLSSGIALYFLWPLMKNPGLDLSQRLSLYGITRANGLFFLAYFSTVHPILEELYWRFLLKPVGKGVHVTELLFAGYHVPVVLLFIKPEFALLCFLVLLVAARLWRFFNQELQENRILFVSHGAADFSLIFFVLLLME